MCCSLSGSRSAPAWAGRCSLVVCARSRALDRARLVDLAVVAAGAGGPCRMHDAPGQGREVVNLRARADTTSGVHTTWLTGAEWAAVLRIGLGLWWLESFRHKNLEAWIKRQAGINWAGDIAGKHKWAVVRKGFEPSSSLIRRR